MDTQMLDQLLLMWREQYGLMQEDTEWIRGQIAALNEELAAACAPFREAMAAIEKEVKPLIVQRGKTYSDVPGVTAAYRKGYNRVSYDSKQTDMVLGFLRDVLPNAAEQLEKARKENAVAPSVSIKAKEG
jgi:hypothetical protein